MLSESMKRIPGLKEYHLPVIVDKRPRFVAVSVRKVPLNSEPEDDTQLVDDVCDLLTLGYEDEEILLDVEVMRLGKLIDTRSYVLDCTIF